MPGSRLNDTEKDLGSRWDSSTYKAYPMLTELHVAGNPGLRGQSDLRVAFEYPVTVLCGRNGSGKSTVLALAALGFHSAGVPAGVCMQGDYYTFQDFFFKGPSDPDVAGLQITWSYRNAARDQLRITKQTKQWMRYARRPRRSVYFVGAVRAVPAIEHRVLRSHFGGSVKHSKTSLDASMCRRLGEIMGRDYSGAELRATARHALRTCEQGGTYSSFNMGAGEDVVIELLFVLQQAPKGSLIVIEEIELGLHPAAAARLALHLQVIALEKHFQLVISSHSEHFIDALPRRARILLTPSTNGSSVLAGPTTRLAMGELSGQANTELTIYCEDTVAAIAIESALTGEQRRRTKIVPIGSDSQLTIAAAHVHIASGHPGRAVLAWDGDVDPADRTKWLDRLDALHENHGVGWLVLPGGKAPEKWVLEQVDSDEGHRVMADRLREHPSTVASWIQTLRGLANHHNVPYELDQLASLGSSEIAARHLFEAAAALSNGPTWGIRDAVEDALSGSVVRVAL